MGIGNKNPSQNPESLKEEIKMTKMIELKTTRTKYGTAWAKVSRFANFSTMTHQYSFQFYKDYKFFNTYNELRDYVLNKYDYTLPEKRQQLFN